MTIPTRELANLIACSLHEANVQTTNEGLLYAGVMAHCDLSQFNTAIDLLAKAKLVEKLPGHELRVTAALKNAYLVAAARGEVRS